MTNLEIIAKLEQLKLAIKDKQGRFFFFVADTNGTPMASIEHIYRIAKFVHDSGYKVFMIHEKEKYFGVQGWLGAEYEAMAHIPLSAMNDNPEYQITGADTFIIPELYADLIKKLKETKLPSETIVICQSHSFIFKYLNAGENWSYYGVEDVITTSAKMQQFLEEYQPVRRIHIINPVISKSFSPSNLPQKPIISIISRNPEEIERLAKLFYQKYPMYSWISFKTLGNMRKEDFAINLKETCVSVWLDEHSTFGTFPLESMACGVPVIVKIPDLIPEWAETIEGSNIRLSDNAVYVSNLLSIPDYLAKFVEAWLLGDLPETLYEKMEETPKKYSDNNFNEQMMNTFDSIIENRILKINETIKKYEQDNTDNTNN